MLTQHPQTNAFLQFIRPWDLAKQLPHVEATQRQLDGIIFLSTEAIRIAGILLQPVMPTKTNRLLDMLGVAASDRGLDFATVGIDQSYGNSGVDLGQGHVGVLFPPLESDF